MYFNLQISARYLSDYHLEETTVSKVDNTRRREVRSSFKTQIKPRERREVLDAIERFCMDFLQCTYVYSFSFAIS